MTPELYRQNMIEIMVLQGILGVLSRNVKALTLEFVDDDVVAHFLMHADTPQDREAILDELPTEVSVFTNGVPRVGDTLVRPIIELVKDPPDGYVPPGRRVLLFRD